MDLAKIRKKAVLASASAGAPVQSTPVTLAAAENAAQLRAGSAEAGPGFPAPVLEGGGPCATGRSLLSATAPQTDFSAGGPTPLEIILSGRRAAGCCEESMEDDGAGTLLPADYLEYLSFRVSDEVYGINILDIKEIIKPRDVTIVPRAPAYLSGILSLRGTIIPVIDLRQRLGLVTIPANGRERIVVIKSADAFSGLLVDEILQVMRVNRQAVEPAPLVLDGIDRDFVAGIGRSDERLLILLNLDKVAEIGA